LGRFRPRLRAAAFSQSEGDKESAAAAKTAAAVAACMHACMQQQQRQQLQHQLQRAQTHLAIVLIEVLALQALEEVLDRSYSRAK
jgi:hypothetical protein